jgi:ribonuclease D
MRENTYWPDLCLVQIGNLEEAAAIDPKAEGIDPHAAPQPARQQ